MRNPQLYHELLTWFDKRELFTSFKEAYDRGDFPSLVIPEELEHKPPVYWINEALVGGQPKDWEGQSAVLEVFSSDLVRLKNADNQE